MLRALREIEGGVKLSLNAAGRLGTLRKPPILESFLRQVYFTGVTASTGVVLRASLLGVLIIAITMDVLDADVDLAVKILLLVVPRVAGVMVATVALTFYIQALAVAGGLLFSPFIIEATFMELASRLFDLFSPVDFYYSIIKSLLFGFAVAAACCYHGLNPPDLTQNAVPK